MNKEEDRILHGLYSFREIINEPIRITGSELEWLAKHTLREGRAWHKDEKFQTMDRKQGPQETVFTPFTAAQMRPLLSLEDRGYIKIQKTAGNMRGFEVTGAGQERARRLQTWYGRIDQWYRDRKDGVAGLWLPAVIAVITSILTTWIIHLVAAK